jgi:hypothetical protein
MTNNNVFIEERLHGLEHIVHSIHHNIDLLEFMAYNLHKERFNLFNNLGLNYIWGSLMGEVLLDFYKVSNRREKHSFQKILNFSKELKFKIEYEKIQEKIDLLTKFYGKSDFETVRSKYLAHQDLGVSEIKTDLPSLKKFKAIIFELFDLITGQFGRKNVDFHNDVKSSFSEIFNAIDEYDEISGFLLANAIKGAKTVEISEIQAIIEKREKNAS